MRKLTIITDVPTPYRIYTFNLLSEKLKIENIGFEVYFLGETAAHRYWEIDKSTFKFNYIISRGIKFVFTNRTFYFNVDIIKICFKSHIDTLIVGGGWSQPTIILLLFLSKFKKWRVFFWLELNESALFFNNPIINYLRKTIINLTSNYLLPGNRALLYLKKLNKRSFNHIFFPNVIDENFYTMSNHCIRNNKIESSLNKFGIRQVIWPARLNEREKGIIKFLSIISEKLLNCNEEIKIIIVGEGPDREVISEFLKNRNLNKVVELKGFVSQNEMKNLYLSSDLFLLPSLIDPNPLSVIEALWSSLPIMISNHCGNSIEAISGSRNGWLLELEDEELVKKSWQQFLDSDDNQLSLMRTNSLNIAKKYFNSNNSIDSLIDNLN